MKYKSGVKYGKTVSVIISVYNRENYIEECLLSVLEQSHKDFEIVLVDDGSTDNTLAICEALAEKEPRIKIIKGEHKGVSAARNLALDNAIGEYLFFLDSDDTIHPLLLEALVDGAEKITFPFRIRQPLVYHKAAGISWRNSRQSIPHPQNSMPYRIKKLWICCLQRSTRH